jgi:tetratricopeptide (TPR) repeat protein
MQRDLPRQRGAAGFTFDTPLENEAELLDSLLGTLARGQLPPEAWANLHMAAMRDERIDQLAQAYAAVAQGKRIRATPPAISAEFLHQAGVFFAEVGGDPIGSIDYWQRALVASPTHAAAFGRLETALVDAGQRRAQANLYIAQAHHRPRAEQADLLRRAVALLEEETNTADVLLEQYQEILRLDPRDEATRAKLEARYLEANRPRDVTRLLEQALLSDPPPAEATAHEIRGRLIQLYAGVLNELERSLPHVEAVLAIDPEHDEARGVAQKLLEVRSLAGRAAAALAQATEATGTPADVARILQVELEHTRGPKRREVLRRLGILKQDKLADEAGAYEAFEQALALDASDSELMHRYVTLAASLGKELDAGRALARFGAAARDPQARARLSAEVGHLYLAGGDPKRARASFVAVLTMPDVPQDVQLRVSRALCAIYAADRDFRALADSLERVALLEPDPEQRQTANEELAELAQTTLRDANRAIAAWRRLVDTPARARALAALEPLYTATGNAVDLAFVLEERANDEADVDAARALAFRAAQVLTSKGEPAQASEAWARFSARFGADRGALAAWIPLLEAAGDWQRLPFALEADASLASDDERAAIFVRLGQVRLQRNDDPRGAIDAFSQALAADPTDVVSRTTLEKLAASGTERLAAALVLEPYYRQEEHVAGVLRVLDLKASQSESADDRMAAILEALGISEAGGGGRAVDWIGRGLAEAVAALGDVGAWIDRLNAALAADRRRYASVLARTLGDLPVEADPLLVLAQRTAEAHVEIADVAGALSFYRRALAYEPTSPELLSRVDDLLSEQGAPAERVALYRTAIEQGVPPERHGELLHTIALIERNDLRDVAAAITTYESAAALDATDQRATRALEELYAEAGRWEALLILLSQALSSAEAGAALTLTARISEVALKVGDPARAAECARAVLDDASASEADIAVIQGVAEALGDVPMLRAVLARRALLAAEPQQQVEWLDRLAALELSAADPGSAVATWKKAAMLAEASGDLREARRLFECARDVAPGDVTIAARLADLLEQAEDWTKLPDLYALMLAEAEAPPARISVLMRHARLLAEHLDDMAGALVSAAQAFELASGSPEYRDVLSTFTMLALRGKATHIFAQAMDDAVTRNAGSDPECATRRTDLRMAKARVLSANREGRDAAVAAYRAILEDEGATETQLKNALSAFDSLLASEPPDGRVADRRWLYAWRAERASGAEKSTALQTWADAEENAFGDVQHALVLYRRFLEAEPENVRVLAAVARLALGLGDAEGAVTALIAQRDHTDGPPRHAIELEIAKTYLHRLKRPDDALRAVSSLLAAMPDDPRALALASELLAEPATRDEMARVLEVAQRESSDPEVRGRIVRALLDALPSAEAAVRRGWYETLFELQRGAGQADVALHTVLAAALEQPEVADFWDQAERLARELERPRDVGDAFGRALAGQLRVEAATFLGERAVAFQEEWFDDAAGVVKILERVLEVDSNAEWAFARLKMIYDSGERWPELFALYDRAIAQADDARKAALYEDAAQIAKDFANDSDRAVDYLERLLLLRPTYSHLVASLERLYERKGDHRKLVGLLTRELDSQKGAEAQRTRTRVAELWLDELKDPDRALEVAEEILKHSADQPGQADPFGLVERVMASAPHGGQGTAGGLKPVRYRAAAILRTHYERLGRDSDLARLFEVELEIATGPDELVLGHRQIANFHEKLGNLSIALEHVATLALLQPDVAAHRAEVAALAARVGRYDRLADVLVKVSEKSESEPLRAELMTAAGDVWAEHLHDDEHAIGAYLSVLAAKQAPETFVLAAARRLEPLLERANRAWDLLDVLERLAALEASPARARAWTLAARLATSLGDHTRAITAWESRLAEDGDAEALDSLIALLERESRWDDLLVALAKRAEMPRSRDERRADRVRIARVQQEKKQNLDAAVQAWTATEAEFGASDESTDALCELLEKTERWGLLEEKIAAAAKRAETDERRATLSARLGDVIRIHRGDPSLARASYEAALRLSPRDGIARAGLLAVAAGGVDKKEVVSALMTAYGAVDDWAAMLELTRLRLDAAETDASRVDILGEAAKLAEDRAADLVRAFGLWVEAFALGPDVPDVAEQLERLAGITGSWREYADAHERALAEHATDDDRPTTFGDAGWRATFRYRLGKVEDSRLSDATAALRTFEAGAVEAPADQTIALSTIDVAARLSQWSSLAAAVVRLCRARGVAEPAALAAAEDAALASRAWDELTTELAREVAAKPLPAEVARDIEARLGAWHRDRRGDPDAAEQAYTRALSHDPSNRTLLSALASIQRGAKGRPLVDSLLRLSEATGGDLDLLREAGDVALGSLSDRGLARTILGSIVQLAQTRWTGTSGWTKAGADPEAEGPVSVGEPASPEPIVRWAIAELIKIHGDDGHPERSVELLIAGARLPWPSTESRRMLHDAALLARDAVRDRGRAIQLLEGLFETDPTDRVATAELAELYDAEHRYADLLLLQGRLITAAAEPAERIALRISSAKIETGLEDTDAAIELLRANFTDSPRHAATVAVLVALFEAKGRFRDLADLHAGQAELAEAAGEAAEAATLWVSAATVAETRLADPDRAIRHYRRALPLEESATSLDALARLLASCADHAGAAATLERLLVVGDSTSSALIARFVEQLALAGDAARARQELERACSAAPEDETLRARLVAMYTSQEAWDALSDLHRAAAERAADKTVKLAHLRAAADLLIHRCRTPDLAIPLMQQASVLDPEDRALKLGLADALVHAQRFPEARALLRSIIDGFAGRRPKERGVAHFHLALLEIAMGNRTQALAELDAATKIDPGNPRILRALAELALADGQVDRAERSYRALLVALKRPEESAEDAEIVRSEVLLELSSIAAGQNQVDRASELVESALESASKSLVEGRRLEAALREKKDFPTLVRALEARLSRATDEPQRVEVLTELARVLDVELGHLAGAFAARQKVLALTPTSDAAHDASLSLARRVDGVRRYLEDVEQLALAMVREGRAAAAGDLHFRCARLLEAELSDDEHAARAYEQSLQALTAGSAAETGIPAAATKQALAALRALEPVYARLGKADQRQRILAERLALESTTDDPKNAADVRYRLAELTLAMPEGALEGGLLVRQAIELDSDHVRAEGIVRLGLSRHPGDDGLLDLLESIGRKEGHEAALLDALATRAGVVDAAPDVVREAAALARRLGDAARAEALLSRYVERGDEQDVGWAFDELAQLREAAGDAAASVAWKTRAVEVALGPDARRLRFEIAKLKEEALGDLAGAADIYEILFDEDPTDRAAADPLLVTCRKLGDAERLVRLLPRVIDQASGEEERSRLRLERVRLLDGALDRRDEAIAQLSDLVMDDPNLGDAAVLLADLLERSGRRGDLQELLARQIDAAKDRQDGAEVEALALKRAALLEQDDRDEARATLYSALDWAPESSLVLAKLAGLLTEPGMESERLEILERQLKLATPTEAEQAALALAELRVAEGNTEAAERAWEIGYQVNPASRVLRDKLEASYRAAGATDRLAELAAIEARSLKDPVACVAALRRVAGLYADVPDAKKAAAALADAFRLASTDAGLAGELVQAHVTAGDLPAAVEALGGAIELAKDDPSRRGNLLLERANLRVELGRDTEAADDLSAVAKLGVPQLTDGLGVQLERVRARAEARGESGIERAMRIQLATVRAEAGDLEGARPLLTELLRREPKDREALRLLARVEERAERWDAATVAYRRLIPLEEGDLAVDTALRLADACERAGRLSDARGALERTRTTAPHDQALRLRLERLYESVGAFRELAEMSFGDAREASDDETKCAHLKRAAALLLQDGTDTEAAIDALVEAQALASGDLECTLLLADAYTVAGRTDDAHSLISGQIAARAGKRSPELASLYHRLARVAHVVGDTPGELQALVSGLEADTQNGFVVAELAALALELGEIDTATRALKAITMLKDSSTSHIPKAVAFQYLGEIARQQGDAKRAMLLLKRAIEEDGSLEEARRMIEELRAEGP